MALKREKQVAAISLLCEGMSIRGVERALNVHRDTIMRLGCRVGRGCQRLLDGMMRNLYCEHLELDEFWGFIQKKRTNVQPGDDPTHGDVWVYACLDAKSKAIPCFRVGKRDLPTTTEFIYDLSRRFINKPQISTDQMQQYIEAFDYVYARDISHGQVVKRYTKDKPLPSSVKYSPPKVVSCRKYAITGNPDMDKISTSYIEKSNHTIRMHCRRMTRLSNGFSKKLENLKCAIAMTYAYYNLVKINKSVRMTPGMALGVADTLWTVEDLVDRALECRNT